jgi:hypothetical protein
MNEKPTRIVQPPVKRRSVIKDSNGRGNYGREVLCLTCDNGVEYEISLLAEIIGMTASGLYQRLRSHGWQHPMILSRKCAPNENIRGNGYMRNIVDSGSDEWRQMSTRPRSAGLARLPEPGIFERQMECGG